MFGMPNTAFERRRKSRFEATVPSVRANRGRSVRHADHQSFSLEAAIFSPKYTVRIRKRHALMRVRASSTEAATAREPSRAEIDRHAEHDRFSDLPFSARLTIALGLHSDRRDRLGMCESRSANAERDCQPFAVFGMPNTHGNGPHGGACRGCVAGRRAANRGVRPGRRQAPARPRPRFDGEDTAGTCSACRTSCSLSVQTGAKVWMQTGSGSPSLPFEVVT